MFPTLGLRGRETSAKTDQLGRSQGFYLLVSWLVSTEHKDRNINIDWCYLQRPDLLLKGMQERSNGDQWDKRKMVAKITNSEGKSVWNSKAMGLGRFDREAKDEETKVRPALQAGGRQGIIIPCLQKPKEHQQASSFPGVRAFKTSLQEGTVLWLQ